MSTVVTSCYNYSNSPFYAIDIPRVTLSDTFSRYIINDKISDKKYNKLFHLKYTCWKIFEQLRDAGNKKMKTCASCVTN